jgi:beta-glucosidase-like glycosyl hydrolase
MRLDRVQYLSGEDPYLGSQLAGPAVAGIQRNKVIANAKHYVDNSQEIGRWTQTEVVDERSQWVRVPRQTWLWSRW